MALESDHSLNQASCAVFTPKTVEEVQHTVRSHPGMALVPWGNGTCQHIGYAPPAEHAILNSLSLNSIVDLSPNDLTVTVESGMTVGKIDEALLPYGLRLPFDTALPHQRTIGGVISTRSNSLRRCLYGSIRDAVLGISVINGMGDVVKAGGRVVKNVSGYDLCKLYCGAFGTLGFITETTLRLVPVPDRTVCVTVMLPNNRNCEEPLDQLISSDLQPSFLYLLNAGGTRAIGLSDSGTEFQTIVIGIDGMRSDVDWQIDFLGSSGGVFVEEADVMLRQKLRDAPLQAAELTVSFHVMSSQVGAFSRMVEWTANLFGFSVALYSDALTGIMCGHFMNITAEPARWTELHVALLEKSQRCGGSVVFERLPSELRENGVDIWSPVLDDSYIMQRIKSTLDPVSRWNVGRFYNRI